MTTKGCPCCPAGECRSPGIYGPCHRCSPPDPSCPCRCHTPWRIMHKRGAEVTGDELVAG